MSGAGEGSVGNIQHIAGAEAGAAGDGNDDQLVGRTAAALGISDIFPGENARGKTETATTDGRHMDDERMTTGAGGCGYRGWY